MNKQTDFKHIYKNLFRNSVFSSTLRYIDNQSKSVFEDYNS